MQSARAVGLSAEELKVARTGGIEELGERGYERIGRGLETATVMNVVEERNWNHADSIESHAPDKMV